MSHWLGSSSVRSPEAIAPSLVSGKERRGRYVGGGPRVLRHRGPQIPGPVASVTRSADRLTLHTARMSAGVSSPQFVGRAKELAALSDALAGAADGNPSVVMVLGVSGVGKTRLVTEFGDELGRATCACSSATASSSRPGISRSGRWRRSCAISSGRWVRIGSRPCSARLGTSSLVSFPRSARATLPRRPPTTRRPAMIPTSTGVRRSRGCSTSSSTRSAGWALSGRRPSCSRMSRRPIRPRAT